MLQENIWRSESSSITEPPQPKRAEEGEVTIASRSSELPLPCAVLCCWRPARGTASAASAVPYRCIDLQLVFPVVLQGPWDKILSLLFIRNHDCPCCTGEAQKVHKVGFSQDAKALGARLCWGREWWPN